jgi:hypothetical protein
MLVLGLAVWVAAQERGATSARVVAVGDVHGAYPEFVAILQRVGLIDSGRQWIGGSSVLVQTGDVPGHGPQTRAVLDLLMDLERQAQKQSGRVIPLLGNHEVMNMIGEVRYVSAEDYQTFANDQSEKVRAQAYQDYMKFLEARGQRLRPDDEVARQQWMVEHPLGFFELRDAYGSQGQYGRWLRQHDAIGQVGDVLFMHGGLNPKLHFRNIEELNNRIRSDLSSFDSLWQSLAERKIIWPYMTLSEASRRLQEEKQSGPRDFEAVEKMLRLLDSGTGLLVSPDSPFWYRGYTLEPEEKLWPDLDKMLSRLKVHYIVVAHTVRPKFDITSHFDKHVFLIDTGMLKPFFGGRASALEIEDGRFTAYYADAEKQVLLAPEAAALPAASPGAGDRQP